ncbi:MAG: glycogen synthase GlgA [Bacteroidales bacterium]|nr:glycogen synthase GlgA [Bacteroidales bacterium]
MAEPLNILMVSSECVPYAKTGGLGDVTGALPGFLRRKGHDARVVVPLYSFIDRKKFNINVTVENVSVQMGSGKITFNICETINSEGVPVYFIDNGQFFKRDNIYHDNDFNDYHDNPLRFTFLSVAALQLCRVLSFKPDIVHANDWHTAILPAFLKRLFRDDPLFVDTASVLTIHNIAYQGRYARYYYDYTGLSENDFIPEKFECFGAVNFLKGGIHFADMVNTVSKGYESETRTMEGGFGLDRFLNEKGEDYIGILNGVDYSQWDPAKDTMIPANYTMDDMKGKAVCKSALQKQLGLEQSGETPLIGIVSRLVEQKGFHILAECIEDILNNMDVQFAILGAGDNRLETFYGDLPGKYPGRVGSFVGYNNDLAHLIEAGSDLFLMPSIYEPCGLNQIYSLKYGTLPVVRATGGLNDTVEDYDQIRGEGTGFKFSEPDCRSIYKTVSLALDTFGNRKDHFNKLVKRAMEQDFSWEESAGEYIKLYARALAKKKHR